MFFYDFRPLEVVGEEGAAEDDSEGSQQGWTDWKWQHRLGETDSLSLKYAYF